MTPNRRSRMRRTRTGKAIALTSRDIEIFRRLNQYRYLRSTYLHAFVGGASETRFKERLGDLFHEGFIDRPSQQWQYADARSMPAVHESGERGRRVLVEVCGGDVGARTFLTSSAHRQFAHSLMICECLASIELATAQHPHLRFIPWAEILARAPESTRASAVPFRMPVSTGAVVPDGLFGLEYQREGRKAYRFFALEADRGTMPVVRSAGKQTSYLAKLAAYQKIIDQQLHKRHLGISSLFVLTVTTSEQRLPEIVSKFGERRGNTALFLFKEVDNGPRALCTPLPRLLTEPWQRAGMPALSIAESD